MKSTDGKKLRALGLTILAVVIVNAAISFASGVPAWPSSPRPVASQKTSGAPVNPVGWPRP